MGEEVRFEGGAWEGEDNSLCSVFFNASLLHRGEGGGQEWGEEEGEQQQGWNGVLKPNIECFGCHQFGHF